MNFEPSKFFAGLIDFFSILLPGAVFAYLLAYLLKDTKLGWPVYSDLKSVNDWTLFWFASYLLGHVLFLFGSLLDEYVYEPIRDGTDVRQIDRLVKNRPLSPRFVRLLASLYFDRDADIAMDRVVAIKEDYLNRVQAADAVNAFQWSKAKLALEHPEALHIVNRFEADSKLFRSFIPVLLGLMGWALYGRNWRLTGILSLLVGFSFWRYLEQRYKSTQQAYWTILTAEAGRRHLCRKDSAQRVDNLTHAGAVVFRRAPFDTEFLIVQATAESGQWVLPKGHIIAGEDIRYCAIREVREETGIWGQILQDLGTIEYSVEDERVRAKFFLMIAIEEGTPVDRHRRHEWIPFDKAVHRVSHEESKKLLALAKELLRQQNRPQKA